MSSVEPTGYSGIYRGICTTNVDPAGLNRVKAIVPQLFGDDTTEIDWALPCVPAGYAGVPNGAVTPNN